VSRSDAVLQYTISNKLSALQLISAIVSAIVSLYSLFALLFTYSEHCLHPEQRCRRGVGQGCAADRLSAADAPPPPAIKVFSASGEPADTAAAASSVPAGNSVRNWSSIRPRLSHSGAGSRGSSAAGVSPGMQEMSTLGPRQG
jgi:hypothetical protein